MAQTPVMEGLSLRRGLVPECLLRCQGGACNRVGSDPERTGTIASLAVLESLSMVCLRSVLAGNHNEHRLVVDNAILRQSRPGQERDAVVGVDSPRPRVSLALRQPLRSPCPCAWSLETDQWRFFQMAGLFREGRLLIALTT
jgi:hypothetical protein